MSKNLEEYLEAVQDDPNRQVQKLFIDDCGMRDEEFANILNGIDSQGSIIKTIVYGNNEMGSLSVKALHKIIPHIREL